MKPKIVEGVVLTSAIKVKETKTRGKVYDGMLGYMHSNSNDVCHNAQGVALFSSGYSGGHGNPVYHANFSNCVTLFAARKLTKNEWWNDAWDYMEPENGLRPRN